MNYRLNAITIDSCIHLRVRTMKQTSVAAKSVQLFHISSDEKNVLEYLQDFCIESKMRLESDERLEYQVWREIRLMWFHEYLLTISQFWIPAHFLPYDDVRDCFTYRIDWQTNQVEFQRRYLHDFGLTNPVICVDLRMPKKTTVTQSPSSEIRVDQSPSFRNQ